MQQNLQNRDTVMEIVFSLLRWIFLIVSTLTFLNYYHHTYADLRNFIILLGFGVLYMGFTELALHKTKSRPRLYKWMTRGGVVSDYIAFLCLLGFTGGGNSPLFPIAYLLILHAAVYWSFLGGIICAGFLAIGYTYTIFRVDPHLSHNIPYYIMNYLFLLMMGVLGGMIVSRERKHLSEKTVLEGLAKTDFLTGLYNHRSFQDDLKDIIRRNLSFTLVMTDIDHFKRINDEYGHVTGDLVLREIGHLLESHIPSNKGIAFRYGGEEFAVILFTVDKLAVSSVLNQFREALERYEFHPKHRDSFRITMSFGVARFSHGQPAVLIEKADQLLYRAKRQGRNRMAWDDEELDGSSESHCENVPIEQESIAQN